MQLVLEAPNYNLVTESLKPFNDMFGHDRLEQYSLNNFPIELVIQFYTGQIKEPRLYAGVLANLVGYEFNTFLKKYLQQLDAKNIQMEVPIITHLGNTELDAVCEFNGEYHTFEAKCQKKLNTKCILQIKKARGQYKNCHVLVPRDTLIDKSIGKRIEQAGGDIIRANIKRGEIIDRVMDLRIIN